MSRADVSVTDPAVNGGTAVRRSPSTAATRSSAPARSSPARRSSIRSSAVGFYLGTASIDLAILDATTGESFVGLQASIGAADLQGIPGFELHIRSASVEVSRTSGTARSTANALTATIAP